MTAENLGDARHVPHLPGTASMRPRPMTAENSRIAVMAWFSIRALQ